MQEYMLQKRGVKSVEAPEKDKVMKSIRAIINEKEEQKLQKKNAVFNVRYQFIYGGRGTGNRY